MTAPLVRVDGLVKHFPIRRGALIPRRVGTVKAVDGVSFEIARGETLALVGESGCGKTTTGRLVLRLIEPTAGRVEFDGEDLTRLGERALRHRRRQMQIVFQDPYGSLNPRMSVGEIVGEPLLLHDGGSRVDRMARVAEILGLVGLSPLHANRHPHEFSGGQRQRIGIARALAAGPKLIVADEPVSALDVSIRAQVVNLLEELQQRLGLTYLFISHDLAVVRHVADRVAVMYLGRIVEIAHKRALFEAPRHPYTRALLGAILPPAPGAARIATIDGDVPSPFDPPAGCRFHPRCPHAQAICREREPELADPGDAHRAACHLWRELPALPAPAGATAADDRLQRLQQYFRR